MQVLSDIRVLDLSRYLPAPYCSMILGDFGADVIRIEQPQEVAKQEAMFGREDLTAEEKQLLKAREMLSRNKRSVLMSLRYDAGKAAVRRMVRECDVLLHDYRPGVMETMGLDYETLKEINPKLVYCAVSLCGQDGPYHDLPGHDPIALALSGAMWRLGDGKKPHIPGLPIGDLSAGMQAALGILLALRARDQSGEGQLVDIAMADSALAMMTSVMQRMLMDKREPALRWRVGNTGVWECADGKYICVTDMEPSYWKRFCEAVARVDLLDIEDRDRVEQELAALFRSNTRSHWFNLLQQAGTQVAPVYTLREALKNKQAIARKTVSKIVDDNGNEIVQVGPTIKLGRTPGTIRHLGRLAGADTEQVLKEFGFNDTDIAVVKRLSE
jgi:crotonobetainyl-CoA:carnitine CoA-transferase CaiB-like acyl-CoA transferase